MRNCVLAAVAALLTACAVTVLALGPHEVLLLVNDADPVSGEVAEVYAELRAIPACNVVHLDVPPAQGDPPVGISPEAFTERIWTPVNRAAAERGLDGHVLAWVYSAGFPTRVDTDPPTSITGLTFCRNRLPPRRDVVRGLYASPLFAAAARPGAASWPATTLDISRGALGDDMPVPSMMLGFVGKRGNTTGEVVRMLRRSAAAEHPVSDAVVYFATNSDIRSTSRAWQYAGAQEELRQRGVNCAIDPAPPEKAKHVMGIMMGTASVKPSPFNDYLPGCIADHFTSFAAAFDISGQTKMSVWVRVGATATAGTVVEPYAVWTKFPHAMQYVYYADGCTLLESIYQGVRCPLQLLPVGDPLAAPWAPAVDVVIDGVPDVAQEVFDVTAVVKGSRPESFGRTRFLVDGRPVTGIDRGRSARIETGGLAPGQHVLRAVVYRNGLVRSQAFADVRFDVRRRE